MGTSGLHHHCVKLTPWPLFLDRSEITRDGNGYILQGLFELSLEIGIRSEQKNGKNG
jgi:hypothetical protein